MQCNEGRLEVANARARDGSIPLTAPNYDRPIYSPPQPKLDPLAAAAENPRPRLVDWAGDRPMKLEDRSGAKQTHQTVRSGCERSGIPLRRGEGRS